MLQKWCSKYLKKDTMLHGLVLLGMLGMACILFSSFLKPDTKETDSTEPEMHSNDPESYRHQIQTELAGMLSAMEGVGTAQVLVTIGGTEEYHYAQEGDSLITEEEVRNKSSYVTIGGSKDALIESISHPPITGVVVACEGGNRSTVQESVYHAVSVACGITTAKIYVTTLESNS